MPCPSAGRGAAQAPEQPRHRRGGPWGGARGQPLVLPAAEPEQQEELAFTGARGLCCGFISEFLLENLFYFFFRNISSMRKREMKMKKTKKKRIPLPLGFGTRSSAMWLGCLMASRHPEPPWGSCHPPRLTAGSGTGHGDPGPQMPPGTAASPLPEGSVLIQGTEGTGVLSSLFLTLQFCLDRKLKAKKNPRPNPNPNPNRTPPTCHSRNQPRALGLGF